MCIQILGLLFLWLLSFTSNRSKNVHFRVFHTSYCLSRTRQYVKRLFSLFHWFACTPLMNWFVAPWSRQNEKESSSYKFAATVRQRNNKKCRHFESLYLLMLILSVPVMHKNVFMMHFCHCVVSLVDHDEVHTVYVNS